MQLAFGILKNTPIWVYVLFAYLIWMGLQGLKPRRLPLWRVALVPAIFIIWGITGLLGRPVPMETLLLWWGGGLILAVPLSLALAPRAVGADRATKTLSLPGSPVPVLRNTLIFAAHYALNVMMAMNPGEAPLLLRLDIAVSGFSLGYFAAYAWGLIRAWRAAPASD